jgi:hypothetical protein
LPRCLEPLRHPVSEQPCYHAVLASLIERHPIAFPDDARSTFQAILKIFAIGVGCAIWLKSMSHAHRDNDHRGNIPENGIGRKF